MPAEGRADHLGQRLGPIDDEQAADLGVEAAFDQIVDERLHDGGVLRRSLDEAERMLVAVGADTKRADQNQVVASSSSLDRSEVIHSDMRSAASATNRREAADFEVPSPVPTGRSPSGTAPRA